MGRSPKKPVKPARPSEFDFKIVPAFYIHDGTKVAELFDYAAKHGIKDFGTCEFSVTSQYYDQDWCVSVQFSHSKVEKDEATLALEMKKYKEELETYKKRQEEYETWLVSYREKQKDKKIKQLEAELLKLKSN